MLLYKFYKKYKKLYNKNMNILDGRDWKYKIAFDNAYTIAGGTVQLFLNDQIVEGVVSSIKASKPNVREIYSDDENSLDLSGITLDGDENILEMRIMSISFNTYSINNPGIGYKFRY